MIKWRWLLCLAIAGVAADSAPARQAQPAAQAGRQESAPAAENQVDSESFSPVMIDGRPIFVVRTPAAGYSTQERASLISERILAFAGDPSIPLDAVRVEPRESWTEIVVGNTRIVTITEAEARAAGMGRASLAAETAETIRVAVLRYRQEHTWKNILRGSAKALLATIVFFVAIWIIWRVLRWLMGKFENWLRKAPESTTASAAWRVTSSYGAGALLAIGTAFRWIALLALLDVYLIYVLGQFPQTQQISLQTTNWLVSKLAALGAGILDYLPNLLVAVMIAFVTLYIVRANTAFFREIQTGKISIRGFDPDWAVPTSNLFRFLIVALALVVVFPYLPGAQSPAFQGVSLFVGLLLSLGSSSAVANAVAGTILTYTRAFRAGDIVQISDAMGVVVDKTLFVTRLRTPKNVVISIPNSSVLGGSVTNYSVAAKAKSLILHTTVTIGYDTPWRQVEGLLLLAAKRTRRVRQEPEPFVLRRELGDFYITYELNVYADLPESNSMLKAYSELHSNILDAFNEFGVQIMSPHYEADRSEKAWVPKDRWHAAPAAPEQPQEEDEGKLSAG